MILECSRDDLGYVSSYFLSVSPAVTWLTVYRRPRVGWWGGGYGLFRKFGVLFLKKLVKNHEKFRATRDLQARVFRTCSRR